MKRVFLFLAFLAMATDMYAQTPLKVPALSPSAKLSQDFSLSNIEISYSRPSMRGRKIFGDVVAYGKVWRTGANAPTKIKIGEELEFAGMRVKPGEYALYTIPNKDKWEIVLNTGVGKWTANGFPREDDVARFAVKSSAIDGECQTFTIMITDITFTSCKIELVWEKTRVVIPVTALNSETVETNIDKALTQPPTLPYFQAANYYFESNKKLSLAQSYVNKALDQDPKAFYIWYLKARIERKLGNKEEAIVAAKKSMELAKGTPNEYEYLHNNQKIIDEVYKQTRPRQID